MRSLTSLIALLSCSTCLIFAQSTTDTGLGDIQDAITSYLGPSYAQVSGSATSDDPLPSEYATSNKKTFILSNDFEITDQTQIREYNFEIKAVTANPDGYERQIYTINGEFPGPLIECNTGDTIRVHVKNSLDIPQTIHWHGISQNGSNVMDGVPGITQCPIPPGQNFTYEFPIVQQYGTYWYHSHFANTMADGIAGPFIVHSPDDPVQRGRDYDNERVLLIQDWMHDQSTDIVAALKSADGYRGSPGAPKGDSILINDGHASPDDPNWPEGVECNPPPRAEVPVIAGQRTRFRIINTGAHSMLRVSMDQHEFEVAEVDTDPVYGPTIHEIPVAPAQRYSIIVNATLGQAGDKFKLRVHVAAGCMDKVQQDTWAVLRYTNNNEEYDDKGEEPEDKPWDDLAAFDSPCRDLDDQYTLSPRVAIDANVKPLQTLSLSSKFGTFLGTQGQNITGFAFNNISFQNQIWDPVLPQIIDNGKYTNENVAQVVFDQDGYVDLILNNLDGGIDHPYHLHGNEFQLIKRGDGNLTVEEAQAMDLSNIVNPLRRDTIFIPGNAYAILRIRTDNPGVWALHCHIGWHLAVGKLATVIVRPQDMQKFKQPEDWKGLCAGQNSTQEGPARRSVAPTSAPVSHLRNPRDARSRDRSRKGSMRD
uniref:Laccase n=1 Tax=Kwoniella pini CBS 10737 TaxID=1296096 RepID=A0A1B9I4P5_9TREE|nr:uncharacterized protein I206_03827 [Kwoniella pini CBS 10737]OCF50503.1 hypothetical protein I206_03827 [Kwoniella pini CBS 10737]